jgi:hypothetical protein
MKTSFRLCGVLIATSLNLVLADAEGEVATKISPDELAKKLFTVAAQPQIQLRGRFEFFSAYEQESLELSSSADFVGEIELASRRTHFDFKNYKSPVAQSNEPEVHAFYSVTFDGKKWVVIDSGTRVNALPKGFTALGEITTERPRLFLNSLDHLCFPLFASLLNVQVGGREIASLKDILNGNALGANVTTNINGDLVVLTVRKDRVTDEFTFDATKAYALIDRRTDFGRKLTPNDNSLVNRLQVKEFIQVANFWFPKAGEFTQTLNGKLVIKRDYYIEATSVMSDAKPIESVIPPNTYVRD